jgi:rod shape-determining protein MreD
MRLRFLLIFFPIMAMFDWWWGHSLSIAGTAPTWLLVATVAVAAIDGPVPAQLAGFGWGLFQDAMAVHLFGGHALGLSLVGYLVGHGRRMLDMSNPASSIVFVVVLSALYQLFYGGLGAVFLGNFLWPGFRGLIAVPFLNGIASIFVFGYLKQKSRFHHAGGMGS